MTLLGTSESKGTPLTLKFPFDKSKYFSKLPARNTLRTALTGSLGGAMVEENRGFSTVRKEKMELEG